MERADHVLSQPVIHRGFAPHRGINLGKQRCGDLDVADTALVTGCGKPGYVADNSSPQGNQGTGTVKLLFQKPGNDPVQGLHGLVPLAIFDDQGAGRFACQPFKQCVQVQGSNDAIADDQGLLAQLRAGKPGGPLQQPGADINRVGTAPQFNGKLFHVSFIILLISLTTRGMLLLLVSTTMSANC